jgi:hypothetical protein
MAHKVAKHQAAASSYLQFYHLFGVRSFEIEFVIPL